MKDNKRKLKQERFRLGIRKNFFTPRTSQAGAQVAQGSCAVSVFEGFQDSTGQSPEQPAVGKEQHLRPEYVYLANEPRKENAVVLRQQCEPLGSSDAGGKKRFEDALKKHTGLELTTASVCSVQPETFGQSSIERAVTENVCRIYPTPPSIARYSRYDQSWHNRPVLIRVI
ncbi:hypothetical protein QYF61_022265 [Mycteria americana]|uniref:Uncharacterized protein n=1 Tax=Mycteria americana TaxID=33587 RepID=A0AAN7PT10_MYCAM|nr:hypothetical protein QYF61_022265 [Mycteria americana]